METETTTQKPKGIAWAWLAWRGLSRGPRMALGVAVIGLLAALLAALLFLPGRRNGHKVVTTAQASLKQTLAISELSTLDYTYNAIVEVCEEDGETPKYYVAYQGAVTAGVDFSKLDMDADEAEKHIRITLPQAEVQSVRVDMGSMEFIFHKARYETETISQEAYQACIADLKREAAQQGQLLATARENAVAAVEALLSPWVKQYDGQYTVTIQ